MGHGLGRGYRADAVVLDLDAMRGVYTSPAVPYHDLVVARARRRHVRQVLVGGRVLAQERVPVLADDTAETLHERIKSVEHRLLPEVVRELCAR